MTDVGSIAERIRKIGDQMVANYQPGPDVVLDKEKGIIPRCLIFEKENRDPQGQGSVVVGVNPGNSSREEQQFYRDRGCSYESVLAWHFSDPKAPLAKKRGKNHSDYSSLTGFVDAAGLNGPILWTELVKCESKRGAVLSIETIRKDINHYLFKELRGIPKDWPLVGVGRKAYEILAYRFSDQQVIGIPHPTSSHGQFAALFRRKDKTIERSAKAALDELLRPKNAVAVWFSCSKGKGCRAE